MDKHQRLRNALYITLQVALYVCVSYLALWCLLPWVPEAYPTFFNLALTLSSFLLFLLATRRPYLAALAVLWLFLAISCIDLVIYSIRGVHVRYVDFLCIGDALRVAGRYRGVGVTPEVWQKLAFGSVATALILLTRKGRGRGAALRLSLKSCALAALALIPLILVSAMAARGAFEAYGNRDQFQQNEEFERVGLFPSLYAQYVRTRITPPVGYDAASARACLAGSFDAEADRSTTLPNIIVVMNESLADYSLMGDLHLAMDPLDGIHAREDVLEGVSVSPVAGGVTCNSEFEFLTGCSLAFLPEGVMPYLSYIHEDRSSLARDLSHVGYETLALHPYYAIEYRRNLVYPFLGFDRCIFGEDLSPAYHADGRDLTIEGKHGYFGDDLAYFRGLVTDAECYARVADSIRACDGPLFMFNVTVMGHGAYDVSLYGYDAVDYTGDGDPEVNDYLNSIARSDDEFIQLLDTLQEIDEPTVVLMFGDHQPTAYQALRRYLDVYESFAPDADAPWQPAGYVIPYFLWTNDAALREDWAALPTASLNYLSAILKEYARLPLTGWDRLRLDAMAQMPLLHRGYDTERGAGASGDVADTPDALRMYENVQYYLMFEDSRIDLAQ